MATQKIRGDFSPYQFMMIYKLVDERIDSIYQQRGDNTQLRQLLALQRRLHRMLLLYKKDNKDEI